MHRIDGSGAIAERFTEGSPSTGQQATVVTAAWLNDVQEAIAYVIEEQGLALAKGDATQLSDAIVALVSGAVGTPDGGVPTTRQIAAGGLAIGGGSLAADRTISVLRATAADVAAGTRDDVAVTPLALFGGAGSRNLSARGFAALSGVLHQWGTASVGPNAAANHVLPTTFPQQCVFAVFEGGRVSVSADENDPFVSAVSASAITIWNGSNETITGRFLAIGF